MVTSVDRTGQKHAHTVSVLDIGLDTADRKMKHGVAVRHVEIVLHTGQRNKGRLARCSTVAE